MDSFEGSSLADIATYTREVTVFDLIIWSGVQRSIESNQNKSVPILNPSPSVGAAVANLAECEI